MKYVVIAGSLAWASTAVASEVAVKVDLPAGVVRYSVCASAPCAVDASAKTTPITIDRTLYPDPKDVKVDVVTIGQGEHATLVKVPAKDRPMAFEAVFVGNASAPVAYSGTTGYSEGQSGDRTGEKVDVIEGQAGARFVVVGQIREDDRICGQDATLLSPRLLDPATLTLHGASVQRLPASQSSAAQPVVATSVGATPDKPLAKLLSGATASTAIGAPSSLLDDNPPVGWSEARSGIGRGEFVSFASPAEVPIARLVVIVAPATPPKNGAAPKTFFVVTGDKTFAVTMPEDAWLHPGAAYEIPFSAPLKTSCLSIVLDDAYARNNPKPDVTLSKVMAYSDLDTKGATLETVAATLTGGGPRADAAAGILKRAGDPGAVAVAAAYDKTDAAGRALAMDVAASAPCSASAPLLVKALVDTDAEVAHKAEGKLERCGKAGATAMTDAVKGPDFRARAKVAPLLALVAPSSSLDVLASVLAQGPKETRADVRHAFALAARSATPEKLTALLDDPAGTKEQKLDLLRAIEPRLAEIAPSAAKAIDGILAGTPDLSARYLSLGPLSTLARAHDAGAVARFSALLSHDPEGPVRTRAAELAPGIAEVQGALLAALSDPDPRVRDASVRSLAPLKLAPAGAAMGKLLESDPWTFVRVSSAGALALLPPSPDVDSALGKAAAKDTASSVRAASIGALGAHRARDFADPVRGRLLDEDEAIDVRAAAARALGAMCDTRSFDKLGTFAKAAASPMASEDDLTLGLASIDALGLAHPVDLKARIGGIDDKAVKEQIRASVRAALASNGSCAK